MWGTGQKPYLSSISHWGARDSDDPRRAKRIILSNQISLCLGLLVLAYFLFIHALGAHGLAWALLPVAGGYLALPFLNRAGHGWLMRFLMVNLGNLTLLAFAFIQGKGTGVHLFLLATPWMALVLFDWEERKTLVYCLALSTLLLMGFEGYNAWHGEWHSLPPALEESLYFSMLFSIQLVQVTVVAFLLLGNRRTELALARAGEAAKAADTAKSQFLANMSHEVRTPLNGILGMSNLLLRADLNQGHRDLVQSIYSSAGDLLAIVNEILDLSRIEAGKLRLENAPFDLRRTVKSVLHPFEIEAARKQLEFTHEIAPGLPGQLVGDSLRLKQVLINLLGNALKFTERGRITVKVSGEKTPDGNAAVTFRVEDTGIGIPEEARGRLFQSFSQADGSASRRFGGTGLGLFISKEIVERMGGSMGCESEPGKGSVFHFTVPCAVGVIGAAEQKPPAEGGTLEGLTLPTEARSARILIVEDQPINRKVLSAMLGFFGCRPDEAVNGADALEACAAKDYELVLMDCHMPEMDGYECTRRLRAREKTDSRLVIVGVTADAMAGSRDRCIQAGMDDVIAKPILAQDLHHVLSYWLAQSAAGPEPGNPATPGYTRPGAGAGGWVDDRHFSELDAWIRSHDPGFWGRVIEHFQQVAPRLIDDMRDGGEAGRFNDAGESAHALKGLCLMMGLRRMAHICGKLEIAFFEGHPDWPQLLAELGASCEPSLDEVRRLARK